MHATAEAVLNFHGGLPPLDNLALLPPLSVRCPVQAKGGVSAWVVDEATGTLSLRKAEKEADARGSQGAEKAPVAFSVGVDHVFGPQSDTEAVFQATARVCPPSSLMRDRERERVPTRRVRDSLRWGAHSRRAHPPLRLALMSERGRG